MEGFGLGFESPVPQNFDVELQQVSLVHMPLAASISKVHREPTFFAKDRYKHLMDENSQYFYEKWHPDIKFGPSQAAIKAASRAEDHNNSADKRK